MASSASTSRIGYTADGTPMPSMPPVTRPDAASLPPLVPLTDRPQPASTVRTPAPPIHAAVSSDVPTPMAGTSYHAYLAGSDDDESDDESREDDKGSPDVPPSTTTQNNRSASEDDDEDTAEEEQLFRVPQPTSEPEKDDTVTVAPLADPATPAANDDEGTMAPTAKCANKTDTVSSPEVSPSPDSSPSTDSFYMRVARFLLGVIVVMVIGYMVYWVLVNVFGIDLLEWTTTTTTDTPSTDTVASSSTNSSATIPPSSDASSVYPPSPNTPQVAHLGETPAGVVEVATGDGRILRKHLTDNTAAALLDMMTSVKRG